jgi:hypothetical protein
MHKRCGSCGKKIYTMIKFLAIFVLATISFTVSGQNIDSLGANKSDILNADEWILLNDTFIKERGDFNFEKKKVVFFVDSNSYRLWKKLDYFESVKATLKNNTTMQHQLLILNEDEKVKSGGYDAFVIAWSKILVSGKQKRKLVKQINGKQIK